MTMFIDEDGLRRELDRIHLETKAAPGASSPARVSNALLMALCRTPNALFDHLAKMCRKNHDALEARIAVLEQTPMEYRGIFQSGRSYRKNAVVTFAGSLWICKATETVGKPGDGPDWTLCCKGAR
jgi:hypothetical protein